MRRRRPGGVAIPYPPPSTVTSARSPATMTRMARDLRALHERFVLQRQQEEEDEAKPADVTPSQPTRQVDVTAQQAQTQTQIASQLEDVREHLIDFQRRWQSTLASDTPPQAETTDRNVMDAPSGRHFFDMAVQTDVVFHDDALLQWLQLITQKVDVLANSFHGDTTKLPIRYPLQPHLDGANVSLSSASPTEPSRPSLSSWHVGRSLEHLVAPATAAQLLDVERAIACLATATQQTTSRYVEYFERIVSQIQEIHQQRLQQVVDESLKELKTQRAKHKKRVEQLDQECQTAKMMAEEWRAKAAMASQTGAQDRDRAAALVEATQQQVRQSRGSVFSSACSNRIRADMFLRRCQATQQTEQLRRRLQQLQDQLLATSAQQEDAQRELQTQRDELQQAKSLVQELMASLESAQREIDRTKRDTTAQSTDLMAALHDRETTIRELQQQLATAQATHQSATRRVEQELTDQRNALELQIKELSRREQSLRSSREQELAALEEQWRQRMQDAVEDTKRRMEHRKPSVASQECQTEPDDELWEDAASSTDERIARLQRRCRALEGLLEKKFEETSTVAGSMSPRSSLCSSPRQSTSTWSVSVKEKDSHHVPLRSPDYGQRQGDMTGTTLPLTSFEFSFEDVAPPTSRHEMCQQQWETTETWAGGSSCGSSSRSSQVTMSAASLPPPSDAPSTEDMMALVRKLEHLATRPEKRRSTPQPDEEPETEPKTPTANAAAKRISRRRDDATLKRTSGRSGSTHMTTANAAKKRVPLRAASQQTMSRR
ncbi:hypothetical protein PINS_up010262 [Pythium insidiosum]|nr:hypothetical protein PINS_up010262 [Pythium insidiosum]